MADDLKDKGPQDRARININEAWEVDYWSKKFGVSADKLAAAVAAVGTAPDSVEKHLAGRRQV